MSNIVHLNKNNNRDNFSVRGLQRAVDDIFDSFFTGWNPELSKEAVAYYQFVTFMKQRKAIAYH